MKKQVEIVGMVVVSLLMAWSWAVGADWPIYNGNNQLSGATAEKLNPPLKQVWVYEARHAPKPAWPEPAQQDFWHEISELRPAVTFDRAFHVVVAGDTAYFGSSAEDKVYALDTKTGRQKWSFFTEGPIRLAPTVAEGKLYVGSDDGRVYCLRSTDGKELWRYECGDGKHRVCGNGRMISLWPVRAGVVVDEGKVYFGAGLFPNQGVYLYALKADDGTEIWKQQVNTSLQGYIPASKTRLYVPTGRTTPLIFEKDTGKQLGAFEGQGGTFALLTEDVLISGPGRSSGELQMSDAKTRETLATFDGLRMIVDGGTALMQSKTELSAFNRARYLQLARQRKQLEQRKAQINKQLKETDKESPRGRELQGFLENVNLALGEVSQELNGCSLWTVPCAEQFSLIASGDVVYAGGENQAAGYRVRDGEKIWTAPLEGRAYGLSAANGALYVSTDAGKIYCFQPGTGSGGQVVRAELSSSPYKDDELTKFYTEAAEQIIKQAQITQGYCLVLDGGEGRLAYELAKRTEMQLIVLEEDTRKATAARAALDQAGMYGARVSVHEGKLSDLGYTSYFANLIVSDGAVIEGKLPAEIKEVLRVLRPSGGVLCLGQPKAAAAKGKLTRYLLEEWLKEVQIEGARIDQQEGLWAVVRRGPLDGSGEWTHQFANVSNTASSMDELIDGAMTIQWFGEPGPRNILDRHNRPMASLYKDGYLIVPGNNVLMAVDAYNGTPLWQAEFANARRLAVLKDCGWVALGSDFVYVATPQVCKGLDIKTGQEKVGFPVPQLNQQEHEWGYLATVGDKLYGSGQKAGASRRNLGREVILEGAYGDALPLVTSDYLFCLDGKSGKKIWEYNSENVIVNSSIVMGGDNIFLVESRNPQAKQAENGRVSLSVLLASGQGYLIKLNQETGEKIWEKQLILPFEHVLYLSYANGMLLALGSWNTEGHVQYELRGIGPQSGEIKWENHYAGPAVLGGSHGEQDQHPVIAGGKIYSRPYNFDLATGEKGGFLLQRGGHGCGTLSASAHYLFDRGSNPCMYRMSDAPESAIPLTRVNRIGCFINMIPAGGLVLAPESSSGCTCAYPIQTSIAFLPQRALSLN